MPFELTKRFDETDVPKSNTNRVAHASCSLLQVFIAFTTGFLSLVWQTVALRIGVQEIGANRATSAAVLAFAMLGLALGAIFLGRLADQNRFRNWLAQAMFGLVSLLTLLFAFVGRPLAAGFSESLSSANSIGAGWAPLAFAFSVILPVHVLIGGIIPSLVAWRSVKDTNGKPFVLRRTVSLLYALETIGAAAGAILTVFILVPVFGLFNSLAGCGLTGVLVSILSFLVSKGTNRRSENDSFARSSLGESEIPNKSSRSAILLLAVMMSSFASLGMELIWQRYFVYVFGSDSRSYAVVVAVMLVGLAIGSSLAGIKWLRGKSHGAYSLTLISIGCFISLSLLTLSYGMQVETIRTSLNWLLLSPFLSRFLLAVAVLLLPAVAVGFAFPLASDLWCDQNNSIGKGIGGLYGVVALANVLGIFCTAIFLIPMFGLWRSGVILGALPVIAGVCFAFGCCTGSADNRFKLAIPAVVTAMICVGLFAVAYQRPVKAGVVPQEGWAEIFYSEDGEQAVAVIESESQPPVRKLMIDGVTIGENGGGVDEKQQLLAHLPFLLREDCQQQSVYTIGLGTGILARELANLASVESVIAAELSPAVIDACELFTQEEQSPPAKSKLKIINDDGIRFLKRHSGKFDAIVSDGKSRPGAASNVEFFSREYYRLCAEKLSDEGLFVQWVSIKCDRRELACILKTFAGSFPYGHVGLAPPGSVYLVGSKSKLSLDDININESLGATDAASLRQYHWASADDIRSMYWLDQSVLQSSLKDSVPINRRDKPVLELYAWDSFRYSVQQLPPQFSLLEELIASDSQSLFNGEPVHENDRMGLARKSTQEILKAIKVVYAAEPDWLDTAGEHWKKAISNLPALNRQREFGEQYRNLVEQAAEAGDQTTEFSAIQNLTELNCGTADDFLRAALILEANSAHDQALQYHFNAIKAADEKAQFRIAFAESLMVTRRYPQANQQLDKALVELTDESILAKKAKLLLNINALVSKNQRDLLPVIANQAAEHPDFAELLEKFNIYF